MSLYLAAIDDTGGVVFTDTQGFQADGSPAGHVQKVSTFEDLGVVVFGRGNPAIHRKIEVAIRDAGIQTVDQLKGYWTAIVSGAYEAEMAEYRSRNGIEPPEEVAIVEAWFMGYSPQRGEMILAGTASLEPEESFELKVSGPDQLIGLNHAAIDRFFEDHGGHFPVELDAFCAALGRIYNATRHLMDEHGDHREFAGGNVVMTTVKPDGAIISQTVATVTQCAAMVLNQGQIGRNDPCPCGSGTKAKRCCGAQ